MITNGLIFLIALMHFGFLILEMFYWTKPWGMKIFKLDEGKANSSKALAANQGLYNGFLSAGLIWSLVEKNPEFSLSLKLFFLGCVIVAGLFGAYSVNRKIFFIQALPALLTLGIIYLN